MELHELISKLMRQYLSGLHTAIPARIEEYDPQTMRAKVVPLVKERLTADGDPVAWPMIVEVPVAYLQTGGIVVRPPYQAGDIVLIVFAERALDKILIDGQPQSPQYTRRHSLDDAIVVGSLRPARVSELPAENTEDLLVLHTATGAKLYLEAATGNLKYETSQGLMELSTDGAVTFENSAGAKLVLTKDGDVTLVGATQILIGSEAAEQPVPLGNALKTWLNSHSHPAHGSPPSALIGDDAFSDKVRTE